MMRTIEDHAQALADARITSRALVEQCLDRIADPSGEGARVFIKVHAEQARGMAEAMDTLRRAGREPSRFAGIPVSSSTIDRLGCASVADSRAADAEPLTGSGGRLHFGMVAGFKSESVAGLRRNSQLALLIGVAAIATLLRIALLVWVLARGAGALL